VSKKKTHKLQLFAEKDGGRKLLIELYVYDDATLKALFVEDVITAEMTLSNAALLLEALKVYDANPDNWRIVDSGVEDARIISES
jgi:hypothetical protein